MLLSYLLTTLGAEKVFRLVEPDTYTFFKFNNPEELVDFFANHLYHVRTWFPRHMHMGCPRRGATRYA